MDFFLSPSSSYIENGEAEALIDKAEKIRKTGKGFFGFFTGGVNYDDISRLYVSAANKYKLAKQWENAASCLIKAADAQKHIGDANMEANYYSDAASVMQKYSINDAMQLYNKAIAIYNLNGRFSLSAKILKNLGESLEKEYRLHEAAECYKKAAEFFDLDEYGKCMYSSCILKYAELSSMENNIHEAIEVFENEGQKALENSLIQYSAKHLFFKAAILHLANSGFLDAKIACSKYEQMDSRFGSSREGKLMHNLIEACEQGDVNKFTEYAREYDNISHLDNWEIHFFSKVKRSLSDNTTTLEQATDLT